MVEVGNFDRIETKYFMTRPSMLPSVLFAFQLCLKKKKRFRYNGAVLSFGHIFSLTGSNLRDVAAAAAVIVVVVSAAVSVVVRLNFPCPSLLSSMMIGFLNTCAMSSSS